MNKKTLKHIGHTGVAIATGASAVHAYEKIQQKKKYEGKLVKKAFLDELEKIAAKMNMEVLEHLHYKPKAQADDAMLNEVLSKVYGKGPSKLEDLKMKAGERINDLSQKVKIKTNNVKNAWQAFKDKLGPFNTLY